MIYKEHIGLIIIIVYIVIGLGSVLRVGSNAKIDIAKMVEIFLTMPFMAFMGFILWIKLCVKDDLPIQGKVKGIYVYFHLMPIVCERMAGNALVAHERKPKKKIVLGLSYSITQFISFFKENLEILYKTNAISKTSDRIDYLV